MKWSKLMYAFAVTMMLSFAMGTATLVSANTKTQTVMSLAVQKAHAQETESPAAPVVEAPDEQPQTPAPEEEVVSDSDFFTAAIKAVSDIMSAIKQEGVSKIAIALSVLLIVAQLLIQLTKTALFGKIFPKASGAGKLLIVSICTVVTTLVPMVMAGVPWLQALTSGAVFSAIMVAGHQIYKQFIEKKE